jgi:L-alanine-DL-glutamate epimerase-like enolase superfamily enzyme
VGPACLPPTWRPEPARSSCLRQHAGVPDRAGDAAQTAAAYKEMGFTAQKWFFRYGPGDGAAGKAQNVAMARAVREAVGEYYTLMFDAFMGWDVAYASEMVAALGPLGVRWVEEPIPRSGLAGCVGSGMRHTCRWRPVSTSTRGGRPKSSS